MKITKLVIIVSLLFIFLFINSCTSNDTEGGKSESIEYADMTSLKNLFEQDDEEFLLIDVRTEGEYNSGYIPTAINIPVDNIADNTQEADKDDLVILYCRSGARAGRALKTLKEQGFTNVFNVGGIIDWTGEVVTD